MRHKGGRSGGRILLAFTFFMGLMLSRLMTAFAGTDAIFLGMATLSTVSKRDLSSMGKFLFIGAIMLLVARGALVVVLSGLGAMAVRELARRVGRDQRPDTVGPGGRAHDP